MPATEEALRQVRVPLSDILAGGGSITMGDVQDAADGGDDAVTHFMAAEQAGPRVDAEPGALLGEDMRPIQGSREATGLAGEAAAQPQPPPIPGAPQQGAPAADPLAPQQQQRSRQRLSPTTRFNEKYRYGNQDFYGERGPDIYSADALGEKLYVPRAGELPMGLFASYAQTNQQQRGENKKAIADLLAGTKNLQTADPYQPAFTKLVTDWQNNFVAGIAEQYGGNQDLAWRETATPGTAANKAYLDGMAAMDALGQFVKFQWGDAQDYIKQVMNAEIRTTPEQRKRAEDVFYGIGNLKGDATGGDFMKLAGEVEAFKRDMNLSKYYKERVQPTASNAYASIMAEPVYETRNGQRTVRFRTKEEATDEFYRRWGKQIQAEIGVPAADGEAYVRDMLPQVRKDEYRVQADNIPTGGSGSGAPSASASNVRMDFRPYFNNPKGYEFGKTDPRASEGTLYFTRFQTTGDKEHPLKEVVVSDGKGPANIPMRDASLVYNPVQNAFYLTGTSLNETGKKLLKSLEEKKTTLSGDEAAATLTEEEAKEMDQLWQKYAVTKYVPADANSSVVSTYYGSSDPYTATAKIVGMPVEQYRKDLLTKEGRERIARAAGLPVQGGSNPLQQPSEPSRQQLADEWQAMKNANPKMTAQQVTDAINKKYKLQ